MYTIYLITNVANNKKYVGVTKHSAETRFNQHLCNARSGRSTVLYNAIRKYGDENFVLEILCSAETAECAKNLEKQMIAQHNSYYVGGYGYNMTTGGDGTVGYVFTDCAKQKISSAGIGRKFSASRNEKIRVAMLNREYKEEWKKNLSAARVGKFTQENNPFYGKQHTEATKRAIALSKNSDKIVRLSMSGEAIQTYDSIGEAAMWVISEGITNAKPTTCKGLILKVCNGAYGHTSCYGYRWENKKVNRLI